MATAILPTASVDPLPPLPAILPEGAGAPDEARMRAMLAALAPLLPELAAGSDLPDFALAYSERYAGDVLHLDPARDILYAALLHAWGQMADEQVVRLAGALAHTLGRHDAPATDAHILQLGIAAAQRMGDPLAAARLLNRLAGLLLAHGQVRRSQRLWRAGLALAEDQVAASLWEPLAGFTHLADLLGNYDAAHRLTDIIGRTAHGDESEAYAAVLFICGFYARVTGRAEQAAADFRACLQVLTGLSPCAPPLLPRQLFTLAVQSELARVQGHYTLAQEITGSVIGLAQLCSDPYTLFDLLTDQVWFTHQWGQGADTQAILLRLEQVAQAGSNPHITARQRALARSLAGHSVAASAAPGRVYAEALSERERAVLQLIAQGLANGEIAAQLVVTPATVKKHLEHIYGKLGVHSRTAAVAQARALDLIA